MENFFCKTQAKGVIRVIGEDAEDYLQSQWTINIRKIKTGGIRYGLRLSTKGKVLADSHILRLGDEEFILISKGCDAEKIIELMEENIVADEVEFSNETEKWSLYTFWNKTNEAYLKFPGIEIPAENSFFSHEKGMFFQNSRLGPGTNAFLCHKNSEIEWTKELEEISEDQMDIRRIGYGLISIPLDIGPEEFPQEGGLEKDAVDFDKGCYLGQEVMARIHAMGRVRRSINPVTWTGKEVPTLPCNLICEDKKVGQLKSLFPNGEGMHIGMALVHEKGTASLEKDGLFIEGINDGKITSL